jgi:colicin import membrane protein
MSEFKIDPNKYAGMNVEEARRAMAEDERIAIDNDPRTQAAVRNTERREAER